MATAVVPPKPIVDVVQECLETLDTDPGQALDDLSARVASEGPEYEQLRSHLTELKEGYKQATEAKNDAPRRTSEITGEIAATLYMLKNFPQLQLAEGYERIGSTGIDQIWAGPPGECGCPDPIVIVEAKGGTADLNVNPVYDKRVPGGCYQMDKDWVALDAIRLRDRIPSEYDNQDYQLLGSCILKGLEHGRPKVSGIAIKDGQPCEAKDYEPPECDSERKPRQLPLEESSSPKMISYSEQNLDPEVIKLIHSRD